MFPGHTRASSLNIVSGGGHHSSVQRTRADMVTNRLQGSRSPKRAPVAADSANGTLLRFQEQYCGHRCHAPATAGGESALVGPLALTLGASAAATDDAQAAQVMPSVLRGSRYLRPAQELLRDAVSLGREVSGDDNEGGYDDEEAGDDARLEMLATSRRIHGKNDDGVQAKLLGLLSELESRQEHYFQELSRVAASFEPALGPAATAGYTSLMSQAMSRHFSNLRRAILRKLAAALTMPPVPTRVTPWADEDSEEEEEDDDYDYDYHPARAAVTEEDVVNRLVRRTKRAAAARAAEQVCKPLRGLPEDSVAVLRAWLFDHFLDPYPSDNEKLRLAVSTGLSRRQISNWFINARVRLWKPMIEEMYNDEFSHDFAVVSREDGGASSS
uniref:Uncharacterized protein n=2 Tax=Avena sativa TaxID=4498 RepID=A0ACD5X611_AVESA